MTHGLYLFLVSEEDVTAEDHENKWDYWKEQVDAYANEVGDENNWYTILEAVTKDGEYYAYDPGKNSRSKNIRWNDAMRLSVGILQSDMRLRGSGGLGIPGMKPTTAEAQLNAMSRDELLALILKEVPATLSWQLMKMSGMSFEQLEAWRDDHTGLGTIDSVYTLKATMRAYMAMINSSVPPFTRDSMSFYDYRCFDLRAENQGSDLDKCAIIYVDIHT